MSNLNEKLSSTYTNMFRVETRLTNKIAMDFLHKLIESNLRVISEL